MKKFLLLLLIVTSAVQAQHTSHYKIMPPNTGSWGYPVTPGDTVVLSGNYTYIGWSNVSGTKEAPITILGKGANLVNGFSFIDCNYFHITADSIGALKINSHSADPTNAAIKADGKCNHFEVDHIQIDSAQYFVVWKTEAQDHPTDTTYWHVNQDDFYLHDFKCNYAKQDGMYFGSTNTQANRPVSYQGKVLYPKPNTVSDIRVEAGTVSNVQRNGIQISNASDTNYINHVSFYNCGFEWSLTHDNNASVHQGVAAAFGGNDRGYFEFGFNTIKLSFLNSFTSYVDSGTLHIHDNIFDSATICKSTDGSYSASPSQNANVLVNSSKNLLLQIWNSQIGYSNNHVALAVYGSGSAVSSFICTTNGLVQDFSGSGLTNNCSGVVDTTHTDTTHTDTTGQSGQKGGTGDSTAKKTVLYFTTDMAAKTATFHFSDGSTQEFMSVDRCIANATKKFWRIIFTNNNADVIIK
jgi:hypothetical protein